MTPKSATDSGACSARGRLAFLPRGNVRPRFRSQLSGKHAAEHYRPTGHPSRSELERQSGDSRKRSHHQGKDAHELYLKVIAEHTGDKRKRKAEDDDLIDDILDMYESDPQFLPEADLKIAALGPFVAALDTVLSTCSFMLYPLLKHPQVLAYAQSEADRLFADGGPTWEGLREMDVMHRAAMETMRMYPVAPLLFRTVTNAFELGGYHIPAGENVIITTTVPHYLPEYFPEPHRFDIERYTQERAEHRRPEVYALFALGAHRCLGNGFAEMQSAVTMATLLHEVELALPPPDYSLKRTQVPLPSPNNSFKIRVVRRHTDAGPFRDREPAVP